MNFTYTDKILDLCPPDILSQIYAMHALKIHKKTHSKKVTKYVFVKDKFPSF
jgi:hypothetical protein